MWAKFQIKIRKHDFTGSLGSYRGNFLKIRYLRNKGMRA
jgi:hypothetical protein